MGFVDSIMGNAGEISADKADADYAVLLIQGERVEKAYQVLRDVFLFTTKRLILVNRQGVTGKKVEYHSIPYDRITRFSVENAGAFDLDAELKIWVTGASGAIQRQFNKKVNVFQIQKLLAAHVLP